MANVEKFKYWCNKILPLVYDDSLSYYEFLGKVYEKLNETIDAVNSNTEAINVFDKRIDDFITDERQARLDWEAAEALSRNDWETEQERKLAAFEAMFVSEYDSTATYTAGDICTEGGKMYAANASTTGTFDPTKWDEIVLSDYLSTYVAEAAEDLQDQYDDFLENYQRTFGIDDYLGGSTTDAISQRAATAAVQSATLEQPGGYGDVKGKYYDYHDGHEITNAAVNSGNLIPCRAGQTIYAYIRYNPSATLNQAAVTFWNANEEYVAGLSVSGNSFTVPNNSNIRYFRLPYAVAHFDDTIALSYWPLTSDPGKYYDLHTIKQEVDSKPDLYHNLCVDTTKTLDAAVSTDLIHSADLIWPNHDGDIHGKFYDYRTGNLNNYAAYNSGNRIPCTPGQTFHILFRSDPSAHPNLLAVTFFDANDEFVTGISLSQNSFTVPDNSSIKYVRVPYNNTQTDAERLCVSLRELSADPLPKPFYNLHTLKDEIDSMKEAALDGSQWLNKTWYAYGTSITSIVQGHYVNHLATMLGATAVNKGIAGGGIGDLGAYSHGQVYDAICNTTDGKLNADLITLETAANDVGADVPLGTIYDTGRDTLAGCLNDCIRYLQTNTNAQIAITVSPANTTIPNPTNKYYEWMAMIEQICRINCVCFIPNESNMGYATITSSHGNDYVLDNIHQTALGGYVYAENMYRYLRTLPTFKTSVPT